MTENIQNIIPAGTLSVGTSLLTPSAESDSPRSSSATLPSSNSLPWYIFRYKMLTKQIKDYFLLHPDKVFFPYHQVRLEHEVPTTPPPYRPGTKKRFVPSITTKVNYVERPCIPGYIFVHATINEAIDLGGNVGLTPWRKFIPCEDSSSAHVNGPQDMASHYHSVSDAVMQQFIRAVELNTMDFQLLDSTCIDLSKDDYVEIISGHYKGYRGHLRSVNGSNGGLVVIPLLEESPENTSLKAKRKKALLHYGIPTRSSQIAILSFAPGSRRATDQLSHAAKVVDKAMEAYIAGDNLTGRQTNRLLGYVHRFSQLSPERPIQRLNLAMLLYRIYVILELHTESQPLRQQLETVLLPESHERMANASRRDRLSAERSYNATLARKQETDNAFASRFKALQQKLTPQKHRL